MSKVRLIGVNVHADTIAIDFNMFDFSSSNSLGPDGALVALGIS